MASYIMVSSDINFGCVELGFLPRREGEDGDDEDARYRQYLRARGYSHVKILRSGRVIVGKDAPPRSDTCVQCGAPSCKGDDLCERHRRLADAALARVVASAGRR